MDIFWDSNERTISEVHKIINQAKIAPLARSTIQIQIQRLEEKGWLKHRVKGKSFIFKATKEREDTSSSILKDIKKRVFGDSSAELVRTLVDSGDVSKNEIDELRKIILEYSEK